MEDSRNKIIGKTGSREMADQMERLFCKASVWTHHWPISPSSYHITDLLFGTENGIGRTYYRMTGFAGSRLTAKIPTNCRPLCGICCAVIISVLSVSFGQGIFRAS